MQDMAFANIQANHHPQSGWESVNTWGYQSHNQPRNNVFSNTYNSDWSNHSTSMWIEPQQNAYWQPHDDFYQGPYASPQLPPQSSQANSGSPMDFDKISRLLTSLKQDQQTQQAQQEGYWQPYEEYYQQPQQNAYWQPYEEFYQEPYTPQAATESSGLSLDNSKILDILTSMQQDMQIQNSRRTNEMSALKNQLGEMVEFIGQIQEQSELSNSTNVNSMGDFEITESITLESRVEVGDAPNSSNSSHEEENLLQQEEKPLPQPPQDPTPPNSSKVVPNSLISNPIPPIAPFSCRFMQSMQDEGNKDILETFPNIQEKEVAREHLEFVKEGIGVDHTANDLQKPNLAENIPSAFVQCATTFKPILQHLGEPPTPISIPISINRLLPSLVQAPNQNQVGGSVYMDIRKDLYPLPFKDPMLGSLEKHVMEDVLKFMSQHTKFKPLPNHFKYHLPFKDQFQAVGPIEA